MSYGTIIRFLSITLAVAVTIFSQPIAHSQVQQLPPNLPLSKPINNWDYAVAQTQPGATVFVITLAQPGRRKACRVRSIESDRLVCRGPLGNTRSSKPEELAGLISPGDSNLKLKLVVGLNAGVGLAAWGTYVLAPICIPCAVTTGVVALFFFAAAGAILTGDDQPAALIYLAPPERLHDAKGQAIRLNEVPSY